MRGIIAEEKVCVLSEVPRPTIAAGEVIVQVRASAINRLDTLQRKGLSPCPAGCTPVLGLEASGEISELSDEARALGWAEGDRVMALVQGGGNAEYVSVPAGLLMKVPESMSWNDSGALPETFLTAFQLLFFVGGFEAGQSVLIHAGGSGVGLALVQLSRIFGARSIFVTAGSVGKIDKAISFGATAGFNRHDNGGIWAPSIREACEGGVDLILDCVGGSYWDQNVNAAKLEANWVLYGTLGGAACDGAFLRGLMKKRISLLATTLRTRSVPYKEKLVARFSREALAYFETQELKVEVDRSFPLELVQQAHEYMGQNLNTGKIGIDVAIPR
eukprot:CAMPEP_0185775310 /NCGR_PEP_ID=MMETSP1174-20130828/81609_1 /TAXON_ID=35687 /ORGANISM="Dictyocha speculum, Strain CCMP1381" /LENGTH=330 /DNA_ID=CAMNT_0028462841 /DNA_START=52 /DNA_END=1044 /DNA_ORIENTATION=+